MDRNYIKQHLLVDRYIQGKLEGREQDAFEERLVWDQSLLEDVQLAENLRDGLKEVSAEPADTADSPGFDLVAMITGLIAVPQFAAAASFLLAVTLTFGVLTSPLVDPGGRSGTPALRTDIVPLFTTRSEGVLEIEVDPDTWTVLLVDVMGDYPTYRVTVRKDDPSADPVWTQDGLLPTYPDSLAVGMPGSALATGRYVLTIEGVRTTDTGETGYEQVQEMPFESTSAD
jgi:hypothetical protein